MAEDEGLTEQELDNLPDPDFTDQSTDGQVDESLGGEPAEDTQLTDDHLPQHTPPMSGEMSPDPQAERLAQLEAENQALRMQQASPPPPAYSYAPQPSPYVQQPPSVQQPVQQEYTAEQLQTAVDNGVITQAQAHQQLSYQSEQRAIRMAQQQFVAHQAQQEAIRVQHDYHTIAPGWNVPGNANNLKLNQELQAIQRWHPQANIQDPAVLAVALRAAFGDPSAHQQRQSQDDRTRQLRPVRSHASSVGHAPTGSKDPLASLTREERREIQEAINMGMYGPKDTAWKEVRKDLVYAKSSRGQMINPKFAHAR